MSAILSDLRLQEAAGVGAGSGRNAANTTGVRHFVVALVPDDRFPAFARHAADYSISDPRKLAEVAPPGWSGSVKAMKDGHPEIDNPWALSWHMYGQGAKPRRKPEKGKPRYKSPGQYAADKKKAEGEDNLRVTQSRFYEIMGCRLTQAQQPTKHVF